MPERSRTPCSDYAAPVHGVARGGQKVTRPALSGGSECARAPGGNGSFPPASRRAGSLWPNPGRGRVLSGKLVRNVSESARIQQNHTKTVRLRHRMDQPAVSVSLREQPTTRGVRDVLQEMSRFQRETSPTGRASGSFYTRSRVFKGKPRPPDGRGGRFASKVEFSKGNHALQVL